MSTQRVFREEQQQPVQMAEPEWEAPCGLGGGAGSAQGTLWYRRCVWGPFRPGQVRGAGLPGSGSCEAQTRAGLGCQHLPPGPDSSLALGASPRWGIQVSKASTYPQLAVTQAVTGMGCQGFI